jgi:multidrug resistance protein, MATE family
MDFIETLGKSFMKWLLMKNNSLLKNMYSILAFALPISAGLLINMIASFLAMMMATQLGKLQLAAGALAMITFMTIMTVFSTIFYALSILISHKKSKDDLHKDIGQIVKNGYWVAMLLMIPSITVLWHIDGILVLFQQNATLIVLTNEYFHYAALTMIPLLINAVNNQFFVGIGKPRLMMLTSLISLPLTLLLAYGFILGHFGLPTLGLAGITCSIFISQSLVCMGILFYMNFSKNIQSYAIFTHFFKPNWCLCKSILNLGLPIGFQSGTEFGAMTIVMYFMGYFGVIALAASQIASQYSILIMMISLGFAQSLSILTSRAYAHSNLILAKQYFIAANVVLASFFVLVFAVFILAPYWIISMYIPADELGDSKLLLLTKNLFVVSGIFLLIDGARNLFVSALRGLHDTKAPMRISVACMWFISLPTSYFVGFTLHGGPVGLRLGFTFGFFMAVIFLWLRYENKLRSYCKSADMF